MRRRWGRGRPATRWGRAALLLVLAAGFLTMHGFLAGSAVADVHLGQQHGVATDVGPHAAATGTHAGSDDLAPDPAPGGPGPVGHHDLAAGCVLALVGVALAGAALLLRHDTPVADLRTLVPPVRRAHGASAARGSPPRVALCVIRV